MEDVVNEVINERLRNISEKIDGINDRLDKLNGQVARHERWIAERSNINEEMQEIATMVSRHGKRFAEMRGGRHAILQLITTLASVVAAAGAVIVMFRHS